MATQDTHTKRPRARNARPKIERAALKLFVGEGIDGSTTRDIAEHAGFHASEIH